MLETNFVRSTLCELHYRSFINFLPSKNFIRQLSSITKFDRVESKIKRKEKQPRIYLNLFAEEQRKKTKELTRSNRENVSRRRCTERICTDIVLRSVTILRVHERLSFLLSG